MEQLLAGLRAAAEPTRLRLIALLAQGELTVTELTHILGQSQPRVSRHLKLMVEAGLLDRFREGAFVFYRLARDGLGAALAPRVLDLLPADDPLLALDAERLAGIKQARAEAAAAFFSNNAAQWDSIRSLHVDERVVEKAMLDALLSGEPIRDLLDIGTGTGRVLEILSPHVERAIGFDQSREMLSVARANLEQAGARNCDIRQGDMYNLPLPGASFDAVTIHQVLHFAEDPGAAVAEAARMLRPGGCLAVVDFAPHDLEDLRSLYNHRRLGFSDEEVHQWFRRAHLEPGQPVRLPGNPLTVTLWLARNPLDAAAKTSLQKGAAA
ncbi:metalloregulator ArsR/SmtB family transcription factor [Telmatospirillum sp. J64-1]|uniref:ArsR/SmtB family transcription factor n=1 Tax=Telmatospirillum sp. J64-1 TaxID=2502183 RepID=UPI00115E301D|nr:metalloregulator ArsR/SmtB family transcription factor [Telmatospirillum sp. J64-1]